MDELGRLLGRRRLTPRVWTCHWELVVIVKSSAVCWSVVLALRRGFVCDLEEKEEDAVEDRKGCHVE